MTVDTYQVALKIFLKNTDGEVLILENSKKFHSAGYYDFPGGRIDTDEFETEYLDILNRELREELGDNIKVSVSTKPVSMSRLQFREDRVFHIFFEADYISGDIQISDEHEQYRWVKLDEIDLEKYFMSGMLEAVKRYLEFK